MSLISPTSFPNSPAIIGRFEEEHSVIYLNCSRELADTALYHRKFDEKWHFERILWFRLRFVNALKHFQPGQALLGIWIPQKVLENWLLQAVQGDFIEENWQSKRSWELAVRYASVLAKWEALFEEDRALILGVLGDLRRHFARGPLKVADYSELAAEQSLHLEDFNQLKIPEEKPFLISEKQLKQLGGR